MVAIAKFLSDKTTLESVEIRWHGRGGQGLVTAGELLAHAALLEDDYFQSFPEFGPERSGAPMRAYTRVSVFPILLHCPISSPDAIVVLDPTLLTSDDVFEGLGKEGYAVINTPLHPSELRRKFEIQGFRLFTVDATAIANETLKRNIPNTPMLGALMRALPILTRESCVAVITQHLGSRMARRVVEANVVAFDRGYTQTLEG